MMEGWNNGLIKNHLIEMFLYSIPSVPVFQYSIIPGLGATGGATAGGTAAAGGTGGAFEFSTT
jgi:hypothetical protein